MSEYWTGYTGAFLDIKDEFEFRALQLGEPVTYEMVLIMLAKISQDMGIE